MRRTIEALDMSDVDGATHRRGRWRNARTFVDQVALDVEALDEQIAREAEHGAHDDQGAW